MTTVAAASEGLLHARHLGNSSLIQRCEEGTSVINPILQMRKLSHQETEYICGSPSVRGRAKFEPRYVCLQSPVFSQYVILLVKW